MFIWNESTWSAIFWGAAFKSTVVLGTAWLLAFAWRKRSAAARHLVWTAAAAALLAMPFLSVSLPALHIATPALIAMAPTLTFHSTSLASADTAAAPAAQSPRAAGSAKTAPWRPDIPLGLMLLWAAGTALAVTHLLLACLAMWRMRRAARPFPEQDRCHALAQALGIRQPVDLYEIPRGGMPMNFGVLRSAIFLPADAREWSEDRRRVVLLHELAHVRRGDVATHLLARTALCLFWWHPLAWTAWREFLKERERAADDLVLSFGEPASAYAGHLLDVARSLQSPQPTAWAGVAMARRSQLEGRLLAILDSGINRRSPARASALVVSLLAVGLVAPIAALQTQERNDQALPPEVDATIRAANLQKNHEILDHVAAEYQKLRQYEPAQKLLETSLALRGQVSGEQSSVYALGLLKLGDLAATRGQGADATDFYTRAVALGDTPEIAGALIYLASHALARKDILNAQNLIERALRVAPAGPVTGRALLWKGKIMLAQGLPGMAESLYTQALAAVKPGSTDAAYIMESYAQVMKSQSRLDEALVMQQRASAIRLEHIARMSPQRNDGTPAVRVGGGTSAPVLLSKREPEYSEEARAEKLQGTVVLYVQIGTDGRAYNVKVRQGLGFGLDEKAVEAVMAWQFRPGTRDGNPVTVEATIEVNFRLL